MPQNPEEMMKSADHEIRRALLAFYDARRRDLPWRRDADDPYRVWVSEVMLQQTQVETVVPYYDDWVERFPDLDALADADEDDVLKAWEGLGYYRRARYLHRAARVVRERFRGELPTRPEELKELPGIGDYTAGAIASIAFNVPTPAVDGNVRRVLCRLHDLEDPAPRMLRERAAALVHPERPGDFNQALMELGATICTPRTPACDVCPVAEHCRARARGTQEERPEPRPSKPLPESDVGTAVIVDGDGRLLLARRPDDGLLAGLWELPGAETDGGETPADAAVRIARRLLSGSDALPAGEPDGVDGGGSPARDGGARAAAAPAGGRDGEPRARPSPEPEPLGKITHTFSHRRIHYHAFRMRLDRETSRRARRGAAAVSSAERGGPPDPDGAGPVPETAWVAPDDLTEYALPAAQHKIAALARRDDEDRSLRSTPTGSAGSN